MDARAVESRPFSDRRRRSKIRAPEDSMNFRRALLAALASLFLVSAVVAARQAAPAPSAPAAAAAPAPGGQQGARGAGGGRQGQPPVDDGPVRGPSGAIIGYTKLAEIPGTPWVIHDAARPQPKVVTPGSALGAPPSDAVVLFNGKDLSQWEQVVKGQAMPAGWPVRDGYFESSGGGSIRTKERFGSIQLHVEFSTPADAKGDSQGRGNSGVILMSGPGANYEIQVLDSFNNLTYADGMAASIYGQDPPLVNAARKPGEWQSYDIIFEAPRFNDKTMVAPAYVTVLWNGVIVHNRRAIAGPTSPTRQVHQYSAHDAELPLSLQDHANPVRFRNVWVRRLGGYDGK